MSSALKDWIRHRIPAIRRRDEKLQKQSEKLHAKNAKIRRLRNQLKTSQRHRAELRRKLATLEDSTSRSMPQNRTNSSLSPAEQRAIDEKPSFRRQILSLRTYTRAAIHEDSAGLTGSRQLPYKLRNYQLADSHGINAPKILRIWNTVDDIELTDLPEKFVIKSDGGAGSQGVLPLTQIGTDEYRTAGSDTTLSLHSIKAYLHSKPRAARPPYFAEEYLSVEDQDGPIPPDVKIFAFYGEVGQILLRTVGEHGHPESIRYRFISHDGTDLGQVSLSPRAQISSDLPVPRRLESLVRVAKHLSMTTGTPFVRVDLYATAGAPTFGEFTRAPGGPHLYRVEHDQFMGDMWLRAQARLDRDIAQGRPPGALYGDHPFRKLYAETGHSWRPGEWPITTTPCGQWCAFD